MTKPLMRIPYTGPLPPPIIVPRSANTFNGAVAALKNFLQPGQDGDKTVLLTGAGISVASGLADYRGTSGTYTLNKTYRPVYYGEFVNSHEARKRYWARSFLGWTTLHNARPNVAHEAVEKLGRMGAISSVITQNVDSFHPRAHPDLPTLELHGFLRSTICVQCRSLYPRDEFQSQLSSLNPLWAEFLGEMIASGALATEDPEERERRGLRSNPDGDVDVPNAPYTTFRYPPCPKCLDSPPRLPDGTLSHVEMDSDGAWDPSSNAGVLKPAVIMFGESISNEVKLAAEKAVDEAGRLLVLGSSLATYSAFRLAKRARDQGKPVGILNIGGVRSEETFFANIPGTNNGTQGVRCAQSLERALPAIVEALQSERKAH